MNFVKKISFISLLFFLSISVAYAELDIREVSNDGYSASVTLNSRQFDMLLNRPNSISNVDFTCLYFVKNRSDAKPNVEELASSNNNYFTYSGDNYSKNGCVRVISSTGKVEINQDWWIANGYEWAYVITRYDNSPIYFEITSEPINILKGNLPSINERFSFALFNSEYSNYFSVSPMFPNRGEYGSHTIVSKIGIMNDKTILKALKKGDNDAYSRLLDYAKNNDGKEFSCNANLTSGCSNQSLNGFSVVNGSYYFVYNRFSDSDALYRNTDSITIVKAELNSLINILDIGDITFDDEDESVHSDYSGSSSDEITSNTSEEVTTTEETNDMDVKADNPDTGMVSLLTVILLSMLTVSLYIVYNKHLKKSINKI